MWNVARIFFVANVVTFAGWSSSPPVAVSVGPHAMSDMVLDRENMKAGTGRSGQKKSPQTSASGKDLKNLLDITPDTRDPHHQGFEPRLGVEDGGDLWTFGRAHAAVQHVLQHSPQGNAVAVADALDDFSLTHDLRFGLGAARGSIIDRMVRHHTEVIVERPSSAGTRGLNILVFNASLGARTLRCLPALAGSSKIGSTHEVVSIEDDHHLSDGSSRLVSHALGVLGAGPDAVEVKHTPLMPAEDTTLEEILETLQDGYEMASFDVVLLGGAREEQQHQLQALLEHGVLQTGATVHSDGLARGESSTEAFIEFLEKSGGRFEYEVHAVPVFASPSPSTENTSAVIIVTVKRSHGNAEL